MRLEFVYLPTFGASAEGLLGDDELRAVKDDLLENPRAGDLIPGGGGVRKLRVAFAGRGKRGSGRAIYLYVAVKDRIYFLLPYPKSRLATLTEQQKRARRDLVRQIEEE